MSRSSASLWRHVQAASGSLQAQRLPPALHEGYFRVQELPVEQLLGIALQFARQLRFYALDNEEAGNWHDFFLHEPSCVLALVVATDPRQLRERYEALPQQPAGERLEFARELCRDVNRWLVALQSHERPAAQQMSQRLREVIQQRLATPARVVYLASQDSTELARSSFEHFTADWQLPRPDTAAQTQRRPVQGPEIHSAVVALLRGLTQLRTLAIPYLEQSLGSARHDPAVSVFFAFVDELHKVHQRLNQFTDRHLRFYYEQVLGTVPRPASPEQVWLRFTPASQRVLVPRGTALLPPGENTGGQARVAGFVTQGALHALPVQVEQFARVVQQRDQANWPECDLHYVARLHCQRAQMPQTSQEVTSATQPLFEPLNTTAPQPNRGDFGAVVYSPLLLLREGDRRISLSLHLELSKSEEQAREALSQAASPEAFRDAMGELFQHVLSAGPAGELSETPLGAEDPSQWLHSAQRLGVPTAPEALLALPRAALVQRYLRNTFQLELSTEAGWYSVRDFEVLAGVSQETGQPAVGTGWTVRISLPATAPPIVPAHSETHGPFGKLATPQLRLTLQDTAALCGYSLWCNVRVQHIHLAVHVEGARDFLAYSHNDPIDPSRSFLPFGPLPRAGSTWTLGNWEIATKPVDEVQVHTRFADLPSTQGGLSAHYGEYPSWQQHPGQPEPTLDVSVDALHAGQWRPMPGSRQPLFAPCPATSRIPMEHTLRFAPPADWQPLPATEPSEQLHLAERPRSGLFQFTVHGPEDCFGHEQYPLLLARYLTASAKEKKPGPPPRKPYTPRLDDVRLAYRARSEQSFRQLRGGQARLEGLQHFTPFGLQAVDCGQEHPGPSPLLPPLPKDHLLYLGLRGPATEAPLSLLWQLLPLARTRHTQSAEPLQWEYLSSRGWLPLRDSQRSEDSTLGLQQSGVITVQLPPDCTPTAPEMPQGLRWLRVGTNAAPDALPAVIAVAPNGVRAVQPPAPETPLRRTVPAGSSWRLETLLPGVRSIAQPMDSFGGRDTERPERARARLSEQLRHKGRALTPWDYERLVLEKFPSLGLVKCFPSTVANHGERAPGQVLIAVLPSPAHTADTEPMLDTTQLQRISDYIQSVAPAFAQIQIRNPTYERVQVRGQVLLAPDQEPQWASRQLNAALRSYLSPWQGAVCQAQFGRGIRLQDIEGFVLDQAFVRGVTQLSVVQVSRDDTGYGELFDTARPRRAGEDTALPVTRPWSLIAPLPHHALTWQQHPEQQPAQPAGVGDLQLGTTFVVGAAPVAPSSPSQTHG